MTEVATDYTAASMIMGMFDWYFSESVLGDPDVRVLCSGDCHCGSIGTHRLLREKRYSNKGSADPGMGGKYRTGGCDGVLAVPPGFCAREYTNYGAIIWPGVTFLTLTLVVTLWRIFTPSAPKEEKLISGLIFLIVWITSLGSNNKLYPSMNNLFLALPYMYWQFYRFCKYVGSFRWKRITISAMPVKCLLGGFFLLFFVQVGLFGRNFAFAEGTGIQDIDAQVTNNETLKGVWMSEERAGWMQGISEYVNERGLAGRDVLIYGQIPALSYYLQMPAAFNPWPDLDSYQSGQLEQDMLKMQERMDADASYRPVVLLEKKYAVYLEAGENALEALQPRKKSAADRGQSQAFADRKIHGRLWV